MEQGQLGPTPLRPQSRKYREYFGIEKYWKAAHGTWCSPRCVLGVQSLIFVDSQSVGD